jgi:amino acid adenylation domain-containing protein
MTTSYYPISLAPNGESADAFAEDVFLFPLSFAQQRLWFLDQFDPGNASYNISTAVRLKGQLNVSALEETLREIVRRHEALRTTFVVVDGEPMQIISPVEAVSLPVEDLSDLEEVDREAEATRQARQEARQPFDLSLGPLIRPKLLRLGAEEHVVLLTMHHIVSDAWSLGVFIKEVAALYSAFIQGKPSPLPELTIQYADFAHWQREWLSGDVLEHQLSYWREQLSGAPAVLEMPTTRPRPAIKSFQGKTHSFVLPEKLSDELKRLGQKAGVTPFITLLAAFKVLLYRYTQQTDILVGTPIAGRNRSETEKLIGFFVNTLVLRTRVEGDESFSQLLQRVREVCLGAYAHQDVPFEKLVEELEPERSLSHTPLFQVMFALQNAPIGALELPGLRLSGMDVGVEIEKFDLTLAMVETEGGLGGTLGYNTDLFDAATIERMAGHFRCLLEGVVAAPGESLAELPLVTTGERHQLLTEWNDTGRTYSSGQYVQELFEACAERAPAALAIVSGHDEITYGELNERANRLAHYLRAAGVKPEDQVCILMERSVEMVLGLLGVLKAGAAYVPLDPTYPQERLGFMLEDARGRILLTQQHLLRETSAFGAYQVICLDRDWDAIARQDGRNPIGEVTAENLAYVIYTSGSTGRPKGVQITHGALLNLIHWHQDTYQLTPAHRATQLAGVGFDASVWELWPYLTAGASLHLPADEIRTEPAKLRDWLVEQNITISFLPTPLAEAVLSLEWPGATALQYLLTGGDQLHNYPSPSLRFKVVNHYGPTESTVVATFARLPAIETSQVSPPIGRPIANTQIYLLNHRLQLVPVGVPGELHIASASLSRGYLNQSALTAEKFIPHPFSDRAGARLYRTGDMARVLADGQLEFLGRRDEQVKVRGFRIELGEIESVLGSHSLVREAVVVAREDALGEKRLVAYVVAKEKTAAAESEAALVSHWRNHLKEWLPEYMIPSTFIQLPKMPLNSNGKLDRGALPVPDFARPALEQDYVVERTLVEEMLIGLWRDVLGVEQVGVHDNFFALGGHSLLATQLMSRMRDAFGVEIALRQLFEWPTVAELAQQVEGALRAGAGAAAPPVVAVSRDTNLPLSFAQQRLWFIDRLEPDSPLYNVPVAIRLMGQVDVEALRRTFEEVVRRHESLRTTFAAVDGQPCQIIHPPQPLSLPILDLSQSSEQEREAQARRLIAEEAQRPFDLSAGPLLRVTLLKQEEEQHVLLLTLHHIVFDGWSLGVLVEEVAALYTAFNKGQPSPLAELAVQYADFAHWQRAWLKGDVLEQQLSYWRDQLAGAPALLDLPTDRPRPAVQTFPGAQYSFTLSPELVAQLQQLSRREGVTLFMTLLAAFQTLLWRYSAQAEICVGTPIAGRNRSETEKLIGFFVNTLVLRTRVEGDESFTQLLRQVREVCLGAYAHQDVPFEKLVEELELERSLSHTPLFQVMFALQNAPVGELELPEMQWSLLNTESATAKFDLFLSLLGRGEGLVGFLEYNSDLFDPATMRRMAEHFRTLLEGIAAYPEQPVAKLPLVKEVERIHLAAEYDETGFEYDRAVCVHQLFERQAERVPDKVAVVFEDQQMSYAELNRRANQLAHYLRGLGVGPEVLVGILMERSVEMIVGLLGVLKAGGAYVPLDPKYPAERLSFMIEDAGAAVLITQEGLLNRIAGAAVREVIIVEQQSWGDERTENPRSAATAENLAYVIYTSGSTGRPKGVAIEHHSAATLLYWARETFSPEELQGVLASTSICFDLSVFELFAPLGWGGKVILAENALALPNLAAKAEVRLINTVPSVMSELVRMRAIPDQVRVVNLAGEALQRQLVEQLYEQQTIERVVNLYGPTEDTTYSTYAVMKRGEEGRVVIGRPIAQTRAYVVDVRGEVVPIGVAGELCLGGEGLARGYLKRADLTAEKFIPDGTSAQPGARLYRTGDLTRYLTDGNIEYLGRIDQQVKIRGFRIELGEIEATLSEHPAVTQAVVAFRDDPPVGQRLVAYIVQDTHHQWLEESSAKAPIQVEQLSRWETIWEQTYHQSPTRPDSTLNTDGWNSSYTGEPIPEAEMREWVDLTVGRILSLEPARVLEIGCGLGLLLFRLAPHCERYYGIDFSPSAINHVRRQLQKSGENFSHVTLSQGAADDLDDLDDQAFDAVILNSVIQYFPNADYLLRVLERAVKAVKNKGFVFVGDVRNLQLLKAFHASVELYRAPSNLPAASLQQRIQQRLDDEEELCVDPAFFDAIKQRLPNVSRVEIQLKRGRYHNEMSRFRYDVVLYVGAEPPPLVDGASLNWQTQNLTLTSVRQLLVADEPEVLRLEQVPNGRLRSAVEIVDLLEGPNHLKTAGEMREALSETFDDGVEVEDLWAMSAGLSYAVEIRWAASGTDDCFDVVFRRRTSKVIEASSEEVANARPEHFGSLASLASNPSQSIFNSRLASRLRTYAKEKLPEYMVPSSFMLLSSLPLTPNGKLDRRALPAPGRTNVPVEGTYIAARDVLELNLTHLWEELLDTKPIGVSDNFFEVGGHSMLAARMMARVERLSGIKLPLNLIFQEPTIERLSRVLRRLPGAAPKFSSLVEIQSGDSPMPFFCVHPAGGHVLCYAPLSRHLGANQTFYGLQAQGLDGGNDPLTRIEEMATHYIEVMRGVQPEGPYLLGGWSMGGVVAYEMARQLHAQGHQIALLALLDSDLPAPSKQLEELDELTLLENFARDMGVSPEQLEISPEELMRIGPEEQLDYVLQRARHYGLLPPDIELSQIRHLFNIFKINTRAMLSYVPEANPVAVTLFRTGGHSEDDSPPSNTVWNALSPTHIHRVSGNHFTMMREPHVEVLAVKLKACLDAAFNYAGVSA